MAMGAASACVGFTAGPDLTQDQEPQHEQCITSELRETRNNKDLQGVSELNVPSDRACGDGNP